MWLAHGREGENRMRLAHGREREKGMWWACGKWVDMKEKTRE